MLNKKQENDNKKIMKNDFVIYLQFYTQTQDFVMQNTFDTRCKKNIKLNYMFRRQCRMLSEPIWSFKRAKII